MTDRSQLEALLMAYHLPVIAVSGGVDSMTLSALAHRSGCAVKMVHAVSPAVPELATARTKALAKAEGWALQIIDAHEFADPAYLANPANRCFFCKTNLYATIADRVGGTLLSGTNLDDLADWRPGLQAARDHEVRHPFVESGFTKQDIRALARELGLDSLAELPASPCLSSRVETGITIDADTLKRIDRVESALRDRYDFKTLRCRKRAEGFVLEVDADRLATIDADTRDTIAGAAADLLGAPIRLESYKQGSAFLRVRSL